MNLKRRGDLGPGEISVLALVILVGILVLLWWKSAGGVGLDFFKNLPDFISSSHSAKEVIKVRYIIPERKVQYYDGVEWYDFTEQVYPKSKIKLNSAQLTKDFEGFYFIERKGNLEADGKSYEVRGIITKEQTYAIKSSTAFSKGLTMNNYFEINNGLYLISYNGEIYQGIPADAPNGHKIGDIKKSAEKDKWQIVLNPNLEMFKGEGFTKEILANLGGRELKMPFELNARDLGEVIGLIPGLITIEDSYLLHFIRQEEVSYPEGHVRFIYFLRHNKKDVAGVTITFVGVWSESYPKRMQITSGKIESNSVYSYEYDLIKNPNTQDKSLIQESRNWADEVISKPIKVNYLTLNKDLSESEEMSKTMFTCVKKINDDLVVDLSQFVTEDFSCGG